MCFIGQELCHHNIEQLNQMLGSVTFCKISVEDRLKWHSKAHIYTTSHAVAGGVQDQDHAQKPFPSRLLHTV